MPRCVALGHFAAERGSARGGGLLGLAAIILLPFGLPVMLLALPSILVALKAFSLDGAAYWGKVVE